MEKQPAIIPEQIHLVKLDIVQNRVDVGAFKHQKDLQLNIGHKMMHNLKDERVKLEVAVSIKNGSNDEIFYTQIDFHFYIEQMVKFYELKKENHPIFSGLFVATLLGISVSTARGIIYEKLYSSGIENVILPIVSPQDMLMKNNDSVN